MVDKLGDLSFYWWTPGVIDLFELLGLLPRSHLLKILFVRACSDGSSGILGRGALILSDTELVGLFRKNEDSGSFSLRVLTLAALGSSFSFRTGYLLFFKRDLELFLTDLF